MALTGRLFNLQRFSLQDGPGLRSTVFLKGCPLVCAWCHNPESQHPEPELAHNPDRCIRCASCAGLAPEARAEACPTGAKTWLGWEVSVEDLAAELLRDRLFFDQSGGGVTFSGGEPLMQPAFLVAAMVRLKREGVHLCLDTCGYAPWEDLREAAALADLVLFDLKLMDPERHRAATGVSSLPILENLESLSASGSALWIRVPIIPGLNDDAANLEATARRIAATPRVQRVDLLPYHDTGRIKFARVGMAFGLGEVETPGAERMETLAEFFRREGITVTIGGKP